jgi:hypothetical protein
MERLHNADGAGLTKGRLLLDDKKRRSNTDAAALQRLLVWDESLLFQLHDVLANKGGFIRDRRRFTKVFRELLDKGCGIKALSQSLVYFWRYENARNTANARKAARFPSRERVRRVVELLRSAAKEVIDLEFCYCPSKAVRDSDEVWREFASDCKELGLKQSLPAWFKKMDKFSDMAADMSDYALLLESWDPPRADSIRNYGLIGTCTYCVIATGKPQFRPVSELFSACSRKDFDPNLLSKRLKYFQRHFSRAFEVLRSELEAAHNAESFPYWVENVDFPELLAKLEKSKP